LRRLAIVISGLPAVGKTTLARRLAEQYGLQYVSGGDLLKELAAGLGYRVQDTGWWETSEGFRFLGLRKVDPDFDRRVDERLKRLVEEGGVAVTSYTLPWISPFGVKIWLKASEEERARRLMKRDGIAYEEALETIRRRDRENRELYHRLYGIRLGEDLSVFHLVIDTEGLAEDHLYNVVRAYLNGLGEHALGSA
jgi:cytidylate kinase